MTTQEHRVLVLGYTGALGLEVLAVRDMLEVASALEVEAGRACPYRIEVATADGAPLDLGRGLALTGTVSLDGPIGTLIVAGGPGAVEATADQALVESVRGAAGRAERVVSVCSGAFLLAAAGLLDGRRATTHWGAAARLAADYPAVLVEPDAIYLRDGNVWTSAGATAACDLVLALLEADLGPDRALQLAREAVVYLRRPGGQSQFSVHLAAPMSRKDPIRDVQAYIVDNPGADLSLPTLAARANLSHRHFARLFRSEVGMTPGAYIERARLEAARRRVETTDHPLAAVAAGTGFGTAENLRRVFVATLGVSPGDYRRRFNPAT